MVCGVMAEQGQIQFSEATLREYHEVLGRYPTRQAALLPTLWMAQREFGWISNEVEDYVARLMELPAAHVRAVVSFYTMFYRQPMGRWHLEVCTNLPCRLRGAEQIVDCISRKLNIGDGQTTADGKFSLNEVECLASCGTAPMLQLNHGRFYENLTPDTVAQLVDELAKRGD
jgi:NADH-quinone oxidoreductase subunit E